MKEDCQKDTMYYISLFALLFTVDASSLDAEQDCQNTPRVCNLSSTLCECEDYYMATLCFFVNTTSKELIVEISSDEQVNFLIRVFKESSGSLFLRLKTKPISCRLQNLTEGTYKIKIELLSKKNQVKCFCGGRMKYWCANCDTKVTFVNYTETWTAKTRTPVLSTPVTLAPSTRKPRTSSVTLTHVPKSSDRPTLSENRTASETDSPQRDHPPDDRDHRNYTHVVIAISTCVVIVISLTLVIWKSKVLISGKLGKCFRSEGVYHSSFTTEENISHQESPLTEKSVILPTKYADNTSNQNNVDSGIDSMCKCSILATAYNGDDVDCVYDEKWGAFSVPKPVTYELEYDVKSGNGQCNGCIPKGQSVSVVQVQQLAQSAPSDVYFSPPEEQSLALSEEMLRINSAYMKSIASERNQQLPVIKERPGDVVRICQVCRSTPQTELHQDHSQKTFDILSLGGKSV